MDNKLLWAEASRLPEHFPEIAPVKAADIGHIFNGNIFMVMLFDIGKGFLDIKIFYLSARFGMLAHGSRDEGIHKKIEMPYQI